MIRRSILVALLLAIGYMGFLHWVRVDWDTTQHLANGNRIKAERFIHAPAGSCPAVITGSSLAYRLDLDSFPPGTVNLGFGGMSIHDGLALIERSGKRPERVLIESNILFRDVDGTFMDALFAHGAYELRRWVPMLREENQPSGVLYGWLRSHGRSTDTAHDTTSAPVEAMLTEQEGEYAVLPDAAYQEACIRRLEAHVRALDSLGTEVIFFEVPIHERLVDSRLANLSRNLVREHFPDHRFVRMPEGTRWRTTDGLHLIGPDAARYSGLLAGEVFGS